MPSPLDPTVGGLTANTYATRAEADTYFGDRLHAAAWTAATNDDKDRALLWATVRLEQEQENYIGARTSTDQALAWPRGGVVVDGIPIDHDEVPVLVKRAQMELAFALLAGDILADSGLEAFDEVTIGPLSIDPRHEHRSGALPEAVRRELEPVLHSLSRHNIDVVRG